MKKSRKRVKLICSFLFFDPIFYKRINKIDIEKSKDIGNTKEIGFLKMKCKGNCFY